MTASAGPYEHHVFVCTNTRPPDHPRGCCSSKGSEEIRARLKALVKERGLASKVRINGAGCLDHCESGVSIVVYPGNVWYGRVTLADVGEIVERHLACGEPVQRLVLRPEELRPAKKS
jgi:(2Fe-2S) ferredoxin